MSALAQTSREPTNKNCSWSGAGPYKTKHLLYIQCTCGHDTVVISQCITAEEKLHKNKVNDVMAYLPGTWYSCLSGIKKLMNSQEIYRCKARVKTILLAGPVHVSS